jgi:hypothetical protein
MEALRFRRRSHPLIVALGSLGVLGCKDDADCSDITRPALTVEVHDAASGDLICDAVVHITAPGFDQTFQCSPDASATGLTCCGLVINGPGGVDYTIAVTATGYTSVTKDVAVPEDECDLPVTQHATLEMDPI